MRIGRRRVQQKAAPVKSRKKRREKKPVKWLWEFSKRVVVITAALYFISCAYALIVCALWQDTATIGTLISEANETFRVVVGGYMIKAGVENALKIGKGKKQDEPEPTEPDNGLEFIDLDEDEGTLG